MNKIALHGVPRSGTTWLGSIIDSSPNVIYKHQPLFSYAFKSFLNEFSSKAEINDFFNKIAQSDDPFINQIDGKASGIIPSFQKQKLTHIVYKEARYHHIIRNLLDNDKDLKVVGIIRDPINVLLSWKNAPKEFDARHWDFNEEWLLANKKNQGKKEEFYGYERWKFVASEFMDLKSKHNDRFYIVKYEDLVENTIKEVMKLFEFCEIPYSQQTSNFLKDSTSTNQNDEPYSVFRTNVKSKLDKMDISQEIVDHIKKDLKGTELERFNNY